MPENTFLTYLFWGRRLVLEPFTRHMHCDHADREAVSSCLVTCKDMPKAVAESAFRMFDTDNSGSA
eukprot:5629046-Amphidinium_carterae.1